MYLLVALSLLSSCFLQSVAESPYQLNVNDHSLNRLLAGDGDDFCCEDQICPTYFFCEEEHCKCGPNLPNDIIACNDEKQISSVLDCYCATYDEDRNVTQIGACVYNCERLKKDLSEFIYHLLPENTTFLNEMVCGSMNRAGTLCGRCLPDHYPLAYSLNLTCVRCPHPRWNWVRYIVAAYLPLTLFYILVLFLQINVTTSRLHPFVYYSQCVSLPALSRILYLGGNRNYLYFLGVQLGLSIYGIWNLDFFRPFYSDICLGLGLLPTLALDYVIAVYPLFLMIISYLLIELYDKNYRVINVMWRPFKILLSLFRKKWDIRTSVIDAFATFFLLSSIKFLSVSFDLLVPTAVYEIYHDHYNYTLGLYYSGDIEYFGPEHLPYAILAIVMSTLFIILPIILLAIYPFPFFQKFLNLFPVRWHILHTFMDSFQGGYKNGTEPGTRDYRWFAALFLSYRLIFFLLYSITLSATFFSIAAIAQLILALLVQNLQPFRSGYSMLNSTFLIVLTMFSISLAGLDTAYIKDHRYIILFYVVAIIIVSFPLLYVPLMIIHWLFLRRKYCYRLVKKIKAMRQGYSPIKPNEEDYFVAIEHPRTTPSTLQECAS